jgi:hypothetical protein
MGKRHWFLRVSRTKIIGIAFKKLVAFFPATFRGAITLKHEYYNRRKAVGGERKRSDRIFQTFEHHCNMPTIHKFTP